LKLKALCKPVHPTELPDARREEVLIFLKSVAMEEKLFDEKESVHTDSIVETEIYNIKFIFS
jgi:hypothetical protein